MDLYGPTDEEAKRLGYGLVVIAILVLAGVFALGAWLF